MGRGLEWVEKYEFYRYHPDGFGSTVELADKLCGIKATTTFLYRALGRGLHEEWLAGWDRPAGITAASHLVRLPQEIKEPLFPLVRKGVNAPRMLAGRLAAEDALSLSLGDQALAWALRAIAGESTAYELPVRRQRKRGKSARVRGGLSLGGGGPACQERQHSYLQSAADVKPSAAGMNRSAADL